MGMLSGHSSRQDMYWNKILQLDQGGIQEKTARREALLRAEAKLLTFTPKIPKRRATSAPKSRPTWMSENEDTSNGNETRKRTAEVYERLYADRFYAEEERMVAKEEQFIRDMRDCTFSPSIPLKKHEKSKISTSTPVWERLYDDKMSIALLREEIKVQKELTGCTFQPSVSQSAARSVKLNKMAASRGSLVGDPVHERLSRVQDAKYDLLEMEKERLEVSRRWDRAPREVAIGEGLQMPYVSSLLFSTLHFVVVALSL